MVMAALVVAAMAAAGPSATDSLPRALRLEEAVALAERNAPRVIAALGERRTSAAAVRSAWGAFLPGVSVSAGTARRIPSSGPTTRVENGQVVTLPDQPWSYNAGLSATVELFSGGQRLFDLQRARARAASSAANEVTQRFAAVLAAEQRFYDVLAARESEVAAAAQLAQAESQLEAAGARLRSRTVTRSDSLRAAIQVRTARLAMLDARTSLETANASLTRAVGTPYTVTASEEPLPVEDSLAVGEPELFALAERGPAVAQAAADLDAARAARRTAWANYLPSLGASYSRSGSAVGDRALPAAEDGFSYSGSLRFSLSFPVFNQFQREEQVTSATVAEENAAAALRDARLAARESLVQSLGTFRAARERVASQAASVEAADEDLRVQQQRYRLGSSTTLDVLTSQTTLDQARRDLIRARYDLRVARAEIEALAGRRL